MSRPEMRKWAFITCVGWVGRMQRHVVRGEPALKGIGRRRSPCDGLPGGRVEHCHATKGSVPI